MSKADWSQKMREGAAQRRGGDSEPGERGGGPVNLAESAVGTGGLVVAAELEVELPGHSSQEEFDRLRAPAVKKKSRAKEEEVAREERVTAYVSRVELEAMEEVALSEHRTLSSWARMVLNKEVGR